jgi:hypothetical protein
MASAAVVYCGYAEILAHVECKNLEALRSYNSKMSQENVNMVVNEEAWSRNRKRLLQSATNR